MSDRTFQVQRSERRRAHPTSSKSKDGRSAFTRRDNGSSTTRDNTSSTRSFPSTSSRSFPSSSSSSSSPSSSSQEYYVDAQVVKDHNLEIIATEDIIHDIASSIRRMSDVYQFEQYIKPLLTPDIKYYDDGSVQEVEIPDLIKLHKLAGDYRLALSQDYLTHEDRLKIVQASVQIISAMLRIMLNRYCVQYRSKGKFSYLLHLLRKTMVCYETYALPRASYSKYISCIASKTDRPDNVKLGYPQYFASANMDNYSLGKFIRQIGQLQLTPKSFEEIRYDYLEKVIKLSVSMLYHMRQIYDSLEVMRSLVGNVCYENHNCSDIGCQKYICSDHIFGQCQNKDCQLAHDLQELRRSNGLPCEYLVDGKQVEYGSDEIDDDVMHELEQFRDNIVMPFDEAKDISHQVRSELAHLTMAEEERIFMIDTVLKNMGQKIKLTFFDETASKHVDVDLVMDFANLLQKDISKNYDRCRLVAMSRQVLEWIIYIYLRHLRVSCPHKADFFKRTDGLYRMCELYRNYSQQNNIPFPRIFDALPVNINDRQIENGTPRPLKEGEYTIISLCERLFKYRDIMNEAIHHTTTPITREKVYDIVLLVIDVMDLLHPIIDGIETYATANFGAKRKFYCIYHLTDGCKRANGEVCKYVHSLQEFTYTS